MSLPLRLLVIGAWVVAILCASLMTWGQACPKRLSESRGPGGDDGANDSSPAWIVGLSAGWEAAGAQDSGAVRSARRSHDDPGDWTPSQPMRLSQILSNDAPRPARTERDHAAARSRLPHIEMPPWVAASLSTPHTATDSAMPAVLSAGYEDDASSAATVDLPPPDATTPRSVREDRIRSQLAVLREQSARAPVAPRVLPKSAAVELPATNEPAIVEETETDPASESIPPNEPLFDKEPEAETDHAESSHAASDLARIARLEGALAAVKKQAQVAPIASGPRPESGGASDATAKGVATLPDRNAAEPSVAVEVDALPVEEPAVAAQEPSAPKGGPDPERIARIEAALAAIKTQVIQKPASQSAFRTPRPTPSPAVVAPDESAGATESERPAGEASVDQSERPSVQIPAVKQDASDRNDAQEAARVARIDAALNSIQTNKETASRSAAAPARAVPASATGHAAPPHFMPSSPPASKTLPTQIVPANETPAAAPSASRSDRTARLESELAALESQKKRPPAHKQETPLSAPKANPPQGGPRPPRTPRVVPAVSVSGDASDHDIGDGRPGRSTEESLHSELSAQIDRLELEIVSMQKQLNALSAAQSRAQAGCRVAVPQALPNRSRPKGLWSDLPLFGGGQSKQQRTTPAQMTPRQTIPDARTRPQSTPSFPNILSRPGGVGEAKLPAGGE